MKAIVIVLAIAAIIVVLDRGTAAVNVSTGLAKSGAGLFQVISGRNPTALTG